MFKNTRTCDGFCKYASIFSSLFLFVIRLLLRLFFTPAKRPIIARETARRSGADFYRRDKIKTGRKGKLGESNESRVLRIARRGVRLCARPAPYLIHRTVVATYRDRSDVCFRSLRKQSPRTKPADRPVSIVASRSRPLRAFTTIIVRRSAANALRVS